MPSWVGSEFLLSLCSELPGSISVLLYSLCGVKAAWLGGSDFTPTPASAAGPTSSCPFALWLQQNHKLLGVKPAHPSLTIPKSPAFWTNFPILPLYWGNIVQLCLACSLSLLGAAPGCQTKSGTFLTSVTSRKSTVNSWSDPGRDTRAHDFSWYIKHIAAVPFWARVHTAIWGGHQACLWPESKWIWTVPGHALTSSLC